MINDTGILPFIHCIRVLLCSNVLVRVVTSYHMPERAMLYAQTYVPYFTYFRFCMNCSELPCARRKWIDNTSQRLNAR
jgi:hypothetical protein